MRAPRVLAVAAVIVVSMPFQSRAQSLASRVDAAPDGRAVSAALHVDGRVVADTEFHMDPLVGTRSHDP